MELSKAVFAPFVAILDWVPTLHEGLPKEFGLFVLILIGMGGFAFMSLFKGWIRWVCCYVFVGSAVTIFLLVKHFI